MGSSGGAWNPWRELRARADIELDARADIPQGTTAFCIPYPGRPVIALDRRLSQVDRNAALAHELVHLERIEAAGGQPTPVWAHTREERAVDDEVARRLVPLDELRVYVVGRERAGERVEVWEVAEEWHVPERVAERALRLLYEQVRSEIRTRRS